MISNFLQKVAHSQKVDFGGVLTNCVALFKKTWQQGAMHVAIVMAGVIPLIILIYGPILWWSEMQRSSYYDYNGDYTYVSNEPNVLFILIWILVVLVVVVLVQTLGMGITAHFFKVCRIIDMDTGEPTGDYFEFFRGGNLKRLILTALVAMCISILAVSLCYLPIFYAIVPLQLMVPIFAFNPKLSVSDIVKGAFKLGNKHWIYVFGFYIVASQVAQLGVILCIVGVVFTASIVHLPVYYFYKDTIGFDEKETGPELLD